LFFFLTLILVGCDELTQRHKEQSRAEQSLPAPIQVASTNEEQRFVFPTKSGPFPESAVALDTVTGRLCKTYAWEDNIRLPKGMPLCPELTAVSPTSLLAGATKAYMGFIYAYDGTKWVKDAKATKYNSKMEPEPWSDDQYDPLTLLSKEEKAKRQRGL
jgi:hypothetical protein